MRVIFHTVRPQLYSIRSDADDDLHRSRESRRAAASQQTYTKNSLTEEPHPPQGCTLRCPSSSSLQMALVPATATLTRWRHPRPRSIAPRSRLVVSHSQGQQRGTGTSDSACCRDRDQEPVPPARFAWGPSRVFRYTHVVIRHLNGYVSFVRARLVSSSPKARPMIGTLDLPYVTPKSSEVEGSDLYCIPQPTFQAFLQRLICTSK